MTFLHFLAAVLFLYVADEQNHSQLHFGKKCFQNENGDIIFPPRKKSQSGTLFAI